MLQFPEIDPVIFSVGPLQVRWYGMMYLVGFLFVFLLGRHRAKKKGAILDSKQVEDLVFYGAMGAVLGGRIGYVFFYGFDRFLQEPLWLLKVWEGGMSFHGGFLGVIVAMFLYSKRINRHMGDVLDFLAPCCAPGLGFGRIANFINGELYGRQTDVSWAMVFPTDPDRLARHPSQLYQALAEGLLLFILVWWFSSKSRPRYAVAGLFSLGYGVARYIVEFYREPDASLAFEWMTRGQLLSLPMIIAGLVLLSIAYFVSSGQAAETNKKN